MEQVQPDKSVLDQVDDIRQQLLGGDSDAVTGLGNTLSPLTNRFSGP